MSATLTTHRWRAHMTTDDSEEQRVDRRAAPRFLNVDEAAELLRTTRRAIYAMVERRQLPGVVRIRRCVLFRTEALLDWVDQKSAPWPKE